MKRIFPAWLFLVLLALLVLVVAGLPRPSQADSAGPKRIAVLNLRTGAGISHWWEGDFDPGLAMTDMLINSLIKSNRYLVFDRQNLDAIMKEQNLGQSGAVTPETAAEIGRLAGVQYIVTGAVTEFSQVSQSGGGVVAIPLPFGVGVGAGSKKVRTALEIHVTDVNTGLYSAGISAKDETVISSLGLAGYYGGVGVGYYNEEFINSALGKSMVKLADNVAAQMETVQFKEIETAKPIEGYVIMVDQDQVYLNVGSKDGVVKGMVFGISRPVVIKDPITAEPRILTKPVGEIKITSVDEDSCVGTVQGEGKPVLVKDKARRK